MTGRARGRGARTTSPVLAAVVATILAACGGGGDAGGDGGDGPRTAAPTAGGESGGTAAGSAGPTATWTTEAPDDGPPGTVRLAFVGDIHTEGSAARLLDAGLGEVGALLAEHDVAVGNLETAVVTDPGAARAAPKQFTFAAPAGVFGALADSGLDVLSLANNHGMDYGDGGLAQTLAAAQGQPVALIGAGADADAAYEPWTTDVDGTTVAVVAATDVLDSFALETWPATAERAGLASSKGEREQLLLDAVAEADAQADVVAVFLHWGVERTVCPTERQRELARRVVDAGADVVTGSHAHVVQGAEEVDGVPVHYGLGNFVWYAREGTAGAETGVLSVEVGPEGSTATWHPASIRGGLPVLEGEPGPPPATC